MRPTFFSELKRRKVGRVFLLYMASSFAVLQGVDVVVGALELPDVVLKAVLILLAVGLPIALVLSWIFDVDPDKGYEASAASEGAGDGQVRPATPWLTPASVIGAAVLILMGVIAGWLIGPMIGGPTVSDRSLAVLPLHNLSPDPENQYFADGIHEDILTQLSKIAGLKVISRTSVLEYREEARNIPEIAAELGVAAVLEGSVRREGDQVRITVQLIDAVSDEHLWAETYDRELEDVFALQAEIAVKIAGSLAAVLTPAEQSSLAARRPTENLDAYEWYVRGSETLTRAVFGLDPRLLAESVEAFQSAVQTDDSFGMAWAYLAVASEWSYRLTTDPEERSRLQGMAAAAVRRAAQVAPDIFETLFATAFQGSRSRESSLEVQRDIGYLERALAANPNSALTLRELGLRHELLGEIGEAAAYVKQAVEIEPRSATYHAVAGGYAILLRDFDGAERQVGLAEALSADNPLAAAVIVRARVALELARGGGLERAGQVFREAEPRLARPDMILILGEFPELLVDGGFESRILSASPVDDGQELVCTCYGLKAWTHEIAGRLEPARVYWDSLSTEVSYANDRWWEFQNADRDHFRQVAVLARAGRVAAARALLAEGPSPRSGSGAGAGTDIDSAERHDTRIARAAAYAALGEAEAATRELRDLLEMPSEVTPASLRDRLVWEPIREFPEFVALLGN